MVVLAAVMSGCASTGYNSGSNYNSGYTTTDYYGQAGAAGRNEYQRQMNDSSNSYNNQRDMQNAMRYNGY